MGVNEGGRQLGSLGQDSEELKQGQRISSLAREDRQVTIASDEMYPNKEYYRGKARQGS